MKKRVLLLAAIVALIAGAGIAYAASSGGGLPGGEPAVWGGGHFTNSVGGQDYERDFSIVATPDGGEWLYGVTGQVMYFDVRVTCMKVSGHNAVIGGIIRDAQNPDLVGIRTLWYATDNGKLATTPDQVSSLFALTASDIADHYGGVSKYFPYVCPPFSAMSSDVSMFDLTSGDIVVQNATQNSQQ
jgi:hypothetical protein